MRREVKKETLAVLFRLSDGRACALFQETL